MRADLQYGIFSALGDLDFDSWAPFADSFTSGKWDLGISVGYGIHSLLGDMILGVGFNKNLQLALYVELR